MLRQTRWGRRRPNLALPLAAKSHHPTTASAVPCQAKCCSTRAAARLPHTRRCRHAAPSALPPNPIELLVVCMCVHLAPAPWSSSCCHVMWGACMHSWGSCGLPSGGQRGHACVIAARGGRWFLYGGWATPSCSLSLSPKCTVDLLPSPSTKSDHHRDGRKPRERERGRESTLGWCSAPRPRPVDTVHRLPLPSPHCACHALPTRDGGPHTATHARAVRPREAEGGQGRATHATWTAKGSKREGSLAGRRVLARCNSACDNTPACKTCGERGPHAHASRGLPTEQQKRSSRQARSLSRRTCCSLPPPSTRTHRPKGATATTTTTDRQGKVAP